MQLFICLLSFFFFFFFNDTATTEIYTLSLHDALPICAYHPILRRLEEFSEEPLRKTVRDHEKRAEMVMDLEEKVTDVVKRLKERGLTSPYLRTFVVARINPLRWIKGEMPDIEGV